MIQLFTRINLKTNTLVDLYFSNVDLDDQCKGQYSLIVIPENLLDLRKIKKFDIYYLELRHYIEINKYLNELLKNKIDMQGFIVSKFK